MQHNRLDAANEYVPRLKLGLIGFVCVAAKSGVVALSLCQHRGYACLVSRRIGFVWHNLFC
jgi:hypothetical protein